VRRNFSKEEITTSSDFTFALDQHAKPHLSNSSVPHIMASYLLH